MADDQDKEIYYPISFLEQMAWVQEDENDLRRYLDVLLNS